MSELLPIEIPKCTLSRQGAIFNEKLSLSEWLHVGRTLNTIGSCYKFLLGDWLAYGEKEHGKTYEQACIETGLDYTTLAHYKQVCGSIEYCRRRQNLSFSHHREVVDLTASEQDNWLQLADAGGWSVMTLRAKLRALGKAKDAGDDGEATVQTLKELGDFIRKVNNRIEGIDVSGWSFDTKKTWKAALSEPIEQLNKFYGRL